MSYYANRRPKWNHTAASHATVASSGVTYDPKASPDQRLVTARANLRPAYAPLKAVPQDADYLVLDVPFGKRGSVEIRQWAKCIGARWATSHKEWRITASRVDADRLRIINDLRLYLNHTTKAAPQFLARIGNDQCLVILSVPFEDRNTAKADGARWDSLARRWYFPMKPNLGLAAFGKTVAQYEAKGWVDIAATEQHNAPFLRMTPAQLVRMREPNEQTAAQKAFTVTGTAPAVPSVVASRVAIAGISQLEQTWLQAVQDRLATARKSGQHGVLVATQWFLIQGNPSTANAFSESNWMRIIRIQGVKAVLIGGRKGLNDPWIHAHLPEDDCRKVWNQSVEKEGYIVQEKNELDAFQLADIVANRMVGVETPGTTMQKIQNRLDGRITSLPTNGTVGAEVR